MAKKQIQSSDFIQDNVLEKTIAEFEAWGKVIDSLESKIKDLAQATKEDVRIIDSKDVDAVKKLSNSLMVITDNTNLLKNAKSKELEVSKEVQKLRQEEIKTIQQSEKVIQEEEKTRQQKIKTQDLETRALIRETKEQERLEKERQKQIKAVKAEDDAYKLLSRERTKAQNEYKRLAIEIGETSKEAQEALTIFNELDERFTSVNKAVKDGRPFVGRYADAIKEAGIEGNDTTKILLNLREEQEELTKTLVKQRKQFGKNSKEVKESEDRLRKLNDTIEEIEKSSKSTERAIDKLTGAVKALVAATVLLKAFEFIADLFTSSDAGADGLAKTLGRLTITIQVLIGRAVNSFDALKNNFFILINDIQLTYFEFLDSLNTTPITIFGKEVFDGQVTDVTDKIKELNKEQKELEKTNTDLSSSFDGLTDEINKKVEANDKAIDQERENIKQIAILEKQSAKLSKTLEELALVYDDDSQSLTDRSNKIKEAITVQEDLNESNIKAVELEVEATRLRAGASTGNAQAQADFINAQARLIEVETQGLTELNGLRRESNAINRDIRDLELDILLDNVDNIKTVNERKIADESLAQEQRKKLLFENVKNIEESFKLQSEVVNKELQDLGKEAIDFNKLLKLSSEDLATFLTNNAGETQAIRILEILKERRTALQDITETQKELTESDKEILRTNEDIILQEEALKDLKEKGADSEKILKQLEEDRAILKEEGLREEIRLLKEKNKLEGGDSLELVEKQNELNELLLKGEEDRIKKENELAEEQKEKEKELAEEQSQFLKDIGNSVLDALDEVLNARYEKIQANLDRELDANKKQQDRLQELADNGDKNALESLQAEREKEQEIEKEKIEKEKELARVELAIGIIKSYASNDGDLAKTVVDTEIIKQLIVSSFPSFEKGTEDTGTNGKGIDGKGGKVSILHPKEAVITKEDNIRKLKAGLTNKQAIDYAIAYQHLRPKKEDVKSNDVSFDFSSLEKAIKDLPNNMPMQELYFDEQEKAYVQITKQNGKINRTHKRSNGLFR